MFGTAEQCEKQIAKDRWLLELLATISDPEFRRQRETALVNRIRMCSDRLASLWFKVEDTVHKTHKDAETTGEVIVVG